MLAAIGPATVTVLVVFPTRPWEGLRPYTPQKEDGSRILPPPSFPSAIGTSPAETTYAEPPDEPPV